VATLRRSNSHVTPTRTLRLSESELTPVRTREQDATAVLRHAQRPRSNQRNRTPRRDVVGEPLQDSVETLPERPEEKVRESCALCDIQSGCVGLAIWNFAFCPRNCFVILCFVHCTILTQITWVALYYRFLEYSLASKGLRFGK
jgi:hypothetical protein